MDAKYIREVDAEVDYILLQHRISKELGFLGDKPLRSLPQNFDTRRNTYFRHLDAVAYNLPQHIKNCTLLKEVTSFSLPPRLNLENLSWDAQNLFMLVIELIIHAYFKTILNYHSANELRNDASKKYLLPEIAIPSWEISKLTGFAPTLSYGLYSLWNYELINPEKPVALDNLNLLHSFTDSLDEKWFVWVHQVVEKTFAPAIPLLLRAYLLTTDPSIKGVARIVTESLRSAYLAMQKTVKILKRMREHCDPNTYFETVRMFYSFPRNVVFLGVPEIADKPQELFGETGGQTPFKHFLQAVLGTYHNDPYFPRMRAHMSKYNRSFIEMILQDSQLREYVKRHKTHRPLVCAYKALEQAIADWQMEHLSLVEDYIGKYGDGHGTGSPPLSWLRGLYEETLAYINEF